MYTGGLSKGKTSVAALALALLALGACSILFEEAEEQGDEDGDGGIDPPENCEAWDPKPVHFDPCDIPAPLGEVLLNFGGTWVVDTDALALLARLRAQLDEGER